MCFQKKHSSDVPQTQLVQAEAAETGKVQWKVYLSYFAAMGYLWVAAVVFFNVASNTFALFSNIWLAWWSNDRPLEGMF